MEHCHFNWNPEIYNRRNDFEPEQASWVANYNREGASVWEEPRMYTHKQLRDIFFCMLHQSVIKGLVDE